MSHAEQEAGFTLIEAMVAVTVLGLVLVTALAAVAADLQASRRSSLQMEAAQLAEEVISQIDTYSWEEFQRLLTGYGERFPSPMDTYRWEARAIPSIDEPGLVAIHLRVEGAQESFMVETRRIRGASRESASTEEGP